MLWCKVRIFRASNCFEYHHLLLEFTPLSFKSAMNPLVQTPLHQPKLILKVSGKALVAFCVATLNGAVVWRTK